MSVRAGLHRYLTEPIVRLIAYHVVFIILASGLVLYAGYHAEHFYEEPVRKQQLNQANKRQLGQIIIRELHETESRFRGLLLFENSGRIAALEGKIGHSLKHVKDAVRTLSEGGYLQDVIPVNLREADEIVEEISYQASNDEFLQLELMELGPKLNELESHLNKTIALLRQCLADHSEHSLSVDFDLVLAIKQTEAFFLRTRENANRIFHDIREANKASNAVIEKNRKRVRAVVMTIHLVANFLVVSLAFLIASRIFSILREQRRTEAGNAQLSTVVEQSPLSIVITDADGRVEYVNSYFEKRTGYGLEEIRGQTTSLLKSGETPDALFADLWKTITAGGVWRGEFCNRTKDGRLFYEEAVISPVFNDQGAIINYAAIKLDVTERKQLVRSHALLQDEQEKLKAILNQAPMGVAIVDGNQRVRWANAFIYRLTECESLEGQQESRIFPPCSLSGDQPVDGSDVDCGEYYLTGAGRLIPVLRCAQKIEWGGTEVILLTMIDLTERKILEDELIQKNKLESVGLLASGIAHEINTPIQFVRHNLEFIRATQQDVMTLLEKVEQLRCRIPESSPLQKQNQQINHLLRDLDFDFLMEDMAAAVSESLDGVSSVAEIVRTLKDFAHPGSDAKISADLNQLIKKSVSMSRNEWKHVADLRYHLDDDLPLVFCVISEIEQVFLNLILNARDAILERRENDPEVAGFIRIDTRRSGQWAEVHVFDNGVGIADDISAKVFDPFFTTKKVGQGSGQGLAICRNIIVEKHQGELFTEPDSEQGTVFVVRLPILSP